MTTTPYIHDNQMAGQINGAFLRKITQAFLQTGKELGQPSLISFHLWTRNLEVVLEKYG